MARIEEDFETVRQALMDRYGYAAPGDDPWDALSRIEAVVKTTSRGSIRRKKCPETSPQSFERTAISRNSWSTRTGSVRRCTIE
jgi:hypothetical protein